MANPHLLGIICASTCALLWAFLALGLKYSLTFSDVETICWFRFSVALIITWTYLIIKHGSNLKTKLSPFPKLALLAGLGLTINYWGYFKCLELTSPSNAQILIQLAPLCLAALGIFLFKEKINKTQKIGFLLAIIGLSLFNGEQISHAIQNLGKYLKGNLVMACSIAGWTSWGLLNKKLIPHYSISIINALIFTVGSIALAPLVDFSSLSSFTPLQWTVVLALGLNTVAAYGLISKAFSLIDTSKVSFIITLNPLGTIFMMKLLAHYEVNWIGNESIGALGLLGASLLLTGVILVVGLKKPARLGKGKQGQGRES